jgi:plastocyanin
MTATALPQPVAVSLFDRKPFYTLLTVAGFALLILAGLMQLVTGLLAGTLAESAIFAAFLVVPGLLGVILPWRFARWGFVLPVLLALALLALLAPTLPLNLAHPEAGVDFAGVLLVAVGAAMGAIGGVVSIIQSLRKSARAGATPAQRRALQIILGVTAAVLVVSAVLSVLAHTTLAPEVRAGATAVQMHNFQFTNQQVNVQAGQTVRLAVKNDDTTLHTFTLPEAGISVVVPAGTERLIEFKAPVAGTYTWFCIPHSMASATGRTGMIGHLIVAP